MDEHEPITQKALFRYQVISAYLAADPPRGKRRKVLEYLAAKTWVLPSGEALSVEAETIRWWLRIYRLSGFEALKDKPRSDKGIRAIPEEIIDQPCKLKCQVPERSIERIITIMENMQLAPPGLLRRSTLHRALQARGLSKRKLTIPDRHDLDRFEADYANDLWQADMLQGPDKPLEVCLSFGSHADHYVKMGMGRWMTQEEALKVLDQSKEAGLVPQPFNAQNPGGMCNCCGDCCGLFVTTCPGEAFRLESKPQMERKSPPATAKETMMQLAKARGKTLIPLAFAKSA